MTKDEHDQVRGPAAVGVEMSQERRVGCPLGERDLGIACLLGMPLPFPVPNPLSPFPFLGLLL